MSQVGHADSKMTLDVYAQLEQRINREHGVRFDALIRAAEEQMHGEGMGPESERGAADATIDRDDKCRQAETLRWSPQPFALIRRARGHPRQTGSLAVGRRVASGAIERVAGAPDAPEKAILGGRPGPQP